MSCSRRGLVQRDAPPIVVVAKSAKLRFPRRHKLRIPRSGHAGQNSFTSLLRLSPPRRHGGDPNAKPAPAPLHPKGTSAPTPWAWALLLSPPRGARRGPHIETSKRLRSQARVEGQPPAGRHLGRRQMRRARWKRKNVRRVGLRQRGPPAAGGGRMAVLCGSQGRKRPALGETSSQGKSGIPAAPIFAAAGLVVDGASATGR